MPRSLAAHPTGAYEPPDTSDEATTHISAPRPPAVGAAPPSGSLSALPDAAAYQADAATVLLQRAHTKPPRTSRLVLVAVCAATAAVFVSTLVVVRRQAPAAVAPSASAAARLPTGPSLAPEAEVPEEAPPAIEASAPSASAPARSPLSPKRGRAPKRPLFEGSP
jgi:hypothetical protein